MAVQAEKGLVASTSRDPRKETDELQPSRMPFSHALTLLELSNERGHVSEGVVAFLKEHLAELKSLDNPFPRDKAASDDLAKGQLVLMGKKASVDEPERTMALQVADRFNLNEVESLLALRAAAQASKRVGKMKEEDWDRVTAWVFEERMAVIGIVALLLRCYEDEDHPCFALSKELLPSIISNSFGTSLLKAFEARSTQVLPDAVRGLAAHATFWATQLVREQKAILEVLFLLYYAPQKPDASTLLAILGLVRSTRWGTRQETHAFQEQDARQTVQDIGRLFIILIIESLNLESIMDAEHVLPTPDGKQLPPDSYFHPDRILAIHEAVEELAASDPVLSAPLVLSWSFLLSKVTNDLVERGVPESYHKVADRILRVPGHAAPMYQLLTSHALSPSSQLFETFTSLTRSSLFGQSDVFTVSEDDPNAVGYVSVLRAVLHIVPQLVRITFLSEQQYEGLVRAFSSLYGTKAALLLSTQLWELQNPDSSAMAIDAGFIEETAIIDLAKSRFPVQLSPLGDIVRSLCQAPSLLLDSIRDEEVEQGTVCMQAAFRMLGELDTLTHVVNTASTVTPLPYEVIAWPDSTDLVHRVTRSIPISRSITVPVGTAGQLVSPEGAKPVVIKWEYKWSAWQLFGDILEDFAQLRKGLQATDDVFNGPAKIDLPVQWDDQKHKEEDVVRILDILRLVIHDNTPLAQAMIEHIESGQPTGRKFHFVEVLLRILERSLSGPTANAALATATVGALTSLLPAFPGVVWTLLQSASFLFNPSSAQSSWSYSGAIPTVLEAEKLAGTYPICRGLVDFVRALAVEYQMSALAISQDFLEVKKKVLRRSLAWLRDEVWIVHTTWRFTVLAERYELTRKVIDIFDLVLEDVELRHNPQDVDQVGTMVVQSLLSETSVEDIGPLLTLACGGADPIVALRKASRFFDAHQLERLCDAALVLLARLVRTHRRVRSDRLSLVEKLALSLGTPAAFGSAVQAELVQRLASFLSEQVLPTTATHAVELLTALALVPMTFGSNGGPSFIALLGGAKNAEQFVSRAIKMASDLTIPSILRVATWKLLSAIVAARPGLAMLVISGRHFLLPADQKNADNLPSAKPVKRTAIDAALETVSSWRTEWEQDPVVLGAVLRFFEYVWERYSDFKSALDTVRSNVNLWDAITTVAFEAIPEDALADGNSALFCHLTAANTSAARLLALDFALADPSDSRSAVSVSSFLKIASDQGNLARALSQAILCTCDPDANQRTLDLVRESCPRISLDDLRIPSDVHPLLSPREVGTDYMYSLRMLRRRLDGFLSESDSIVDMDIFADVVERIADLNSSMSLVDAEIDNTRAWRAVFEECGPFLLKDRQACKSVVAVASLLAGDIADEQREGSIIETVHAARLAILSAMVTCLSAVPASEVSQDLQGLLTELGRILSSLAMPPLESIARRVEPPFHAEIFRIAVLLFWKINNDKVTLKEEEKSKLSPAIDTVLRFLLTAMRDLLVLIRAQHDSTLDDDLSMIVALLGQVLRSSFVPPTTVWIPHCQSLDLFRQAFEVFVHLNGQPASIALGQHILDLGLVMASSAPALAELLAVEGVMTALTNNTITDAAADGHIAVFAADGQRNPEHRLWTTQLALVVSMIAAIGEDTRFVEEEVTGFIHLYRQQISNALNWNSSVMLSLPLLEEISYSVSLVNGLCQHPHADSRVISAFVEDMLNLLQHVSYALLHPNHLMSLMQPTTPAERAWLDSDTGESTSLSSRPVLGCVTLVMLDIARTIMDALVSYTDAFNVLTGDVTTWYTERAIIKPTATVTRSEKSSIGTLFDIASFSADCLKTSNGTANASKVGSMPSGLAFPAYSTSLLRSRCAQITESFAVLATAQLALWLERPEPVSRATTLMHRDITGELATDLVASLNKAIELGKELKKEGEGPDAEMLKLVKTFAEKRLVERKD